MKGAILGLLLPALISISQAVGCQTYSCKWWFESMDKDLCVKVNKEPGTRQLLKNCDSGKVCQANEWRSQYSADTDAKCIDPSDPSLNSTMPGDFCTKNSDCYGEIDMVSCENGVCQTTAQARDYCRDAYPDIRGDWRCPVGTYCHTNRYCAEQLKEGEVCYLGKQCTSGYNCAMVNNTGFRCTKLWSLNEGDQFDFMRATVKDPVLQFHSLCKSNWARQVYPDSQIYECRQAPFNKKARKLSDLRKAKKRRNECHYTVFDDDSDISKPIDRSLEADCGFNKDSHGYCDKQVGDKWFQSVLEKVQQTDYASIICHVNSTLSECASFNEVIPKELYNQFFRELVSTPTGYLSVNGGGYALFANNDKCVAESITAWYWRGDKPYSDSDTESVVSATI